MAEYTITDPFGNESTHTTLTALEQVLAQGIPETLSNERCPIQLSE